MNGWYMHNPKTWPPSKDIIPLLISIHLNKSKYFVLESNDVRTFLNENGPVGCRDIQTYEILQKYGIDSYLSSCLTLTLDYKYKYNGMRKGVFIVDPFFNYPKYEDLYKNPKKTLVDLLYKKKKIVDFEKSETYLNKIFDKSFLKKSVRLTHVYKKINYTEDELFHEAEKLIRIYASAELVITSRIHCALPCLSLGTPVLFLDSGFDDENEQSRLKGIKELFNVVGIDSHGKIFSNNISIKGKIGSELKIQNKNDYLIYKDLLIHKVKKFTEK
jgi:hypothetical protein